LRLLVQRHVREVGIETPIHFTRYHPAYKFKKPPTKVATLELAYRIAKAEGILFPYIGNVTGHRHENTYCPQCQELLICRDGCRLKEYRLTKDQRCPSCNLQVPIAGKHTQKRLSSSLWVSPAPDSSDKL
jgi:pyruvate formate lyase activating enzyme